MLDCKYNSNLYKELPSNPDILDGRGENFCRRPGHSPTPTPGAHAHTHTHTHVSQHHPQRNTSRVSLSVSHRGSGCNSDTVSACFRISQPEPLREGWSGVSCFQSAPLPTGLVPGSLTASLREQPSRVPEGAGLPVLGPTFALEPPLRWKADLDEKPAPFVHYVPSIETHSQRPCFPFCEKRLGKLCSQTKRPHPVPTGPQPLGPLGPSSKVVSIHSAA